MKIKVIAWSVGEREREVGDDEMRLETRIFNFNNDFLNVVGITKYWKLMKCQY